MKQSTAIQILTLLTLFTVGCAPLLIGGAGVAGYHIGKDNRAVGQQAEDARITSEINLKFARDELVSAADVDVDTYEGVVTLWGHLTSQRAIDRAIELARTIKGVLDVKSNLKVIPD